MIDPKQGICQPPGATSLGDGAPVFGPPMVVADELGANWDRVEVRRTINRFHSYNSTTDLVRWDSSAAKTIRRLVITRSW